MKSKGTLEQHAELDAEYIALLNALPEDGYGFYARFGVMNLWREEKMYLSAYGGRWPKVTKITVPRL